MEVPTRERCIEPSECANMIPTSYHEVACLAILLWTKAHHRNDGDASDSRGYGELANVVKHKKMPSMSENNDVPSGSP